MRQHTHGDTQEGFGAVADAFARNFAEGREVGAACAVYRDGELVVDLWGGMADDQSGRPWEAGTMAVWNSSTKGATATAFLQLVERGLVDVESPVAAYWPEFAENGKEAVTVRQVLNHSSGVAALDLPLLDLDDVHAWKPLVDALARQAPCWEPGTRHGYHAQTFGFLLDEIARRVTGRTLGELFAENVAAPLALDLYLGLPPELEPRVARMVPPSDELPEDDPLIEKLTEHLLDPDSLILRAVSNPLIADSWEVVNTSPYRTAPLTSANGIGTARSMAKMYAATIGEVDGVRVLSAETVELARTEQVRGDDAVIAGIESSWGLGYARDCQLNPFNAPGAHGHGGSGGSYGFADPGYGVTFAYLMNRMERTFFDVRTRRLIEAVYGCLGA